MNKTRYYSAKLALAGKSHLIFMNYLAGLTDLATPEEEYYLARAKLAEHKVTCDGCTKKALVAIKDGFAKSR